MKLQANFFFERIMHNRLYEYLLCNTVIPRFSAPGRLLIQTVLEGALIRRGRLFKNIDK